MKISNFKSLGILLTLAVILFSCKDKEELPAVAQEPSSAVNRWILDVMDEVYYWLSDLRTPISESATAEDYFEALLFRPTDRFSAIYPDYQELINSLNGISLESGYEFILYRESSSNDNVYAEVTYIKKNSPASSVDLKRGDRIVSINNTAITVSNFRTVLGFTESTHTLGYARFEESSSAFVSKPNVSLSPVALSENPNFLDTIYTVDNEKIGYVIYHFFTPGPGNNSIQYDKEMDAIFAGFKSESIDHLIIDFRYNGGGFVSSAINLASLIAPGVDTTAVFSKTKYNAFIEAQIPELRNVNTRFRAKAQNLGNSLVGNRVYILTSARTASASELIINGLRPYMDVFLIGNTTTGKNVGSIPFQDEANPQNKYGILPIVTQSFNSKDESDYTTGFVPSIMTLESSERLRPLGDRNELLLRTAISRITGVTPSGRLEQLNRTDLGGSLDQKIRMRRMIESNPINKY
jgi:C-terminal processing protease CtpA/Prc